MHSMKVIPSIMAFVLSSMIASCAALPVKEYNTATELKGKVQKYDLGVYAPDESKKSDALYNDGVKYYNKDNGKSKSSLDEAITNYQFVIDKGFPAKISGVTAEADSNKSQALSIKADKYLQKDFESAGALYQQAALELSNKNYEIALDKIESAKSAFMKLYQQAKGKMDSGAALIQQVQQKLDDVNKETQAIRDAKVKSEEIEKSLQSEPKTNL